MDTQTNADWMSAFAAYLTRRFPDRSTTKHYLSDLQIFVQQCTHALPDVTRADIDTFVDAERARGLAPATLKRRAAALKTFFDFLADERHDPTRPNPVSMRRHAGRQPHLLPRDLTDSEVATFLASVDDVRDQAMICLMLYAGLRVGEVATLHPADLTVPTDAQAPIRLRVLGKGRKERLAYLTPHGYQPLATYLQADPPAAPQAPLFRTRFGTAFTVGGIQERIQQYAQRSGVAVTCHRLRHTYGRWMAEGEMPVLTLSRLLGHSNIQTTQRYLDGADPQVRRSYEAALERQAVTIQIAPAAPALVTAPGAPGPATVVRLDPPPLDGGAWMPTAPAWLRESCLAWLQHQWPIWKPSQRRQHAVQRLRELRSFWQWQLARRPFGGWADLTSAEIAAFMDAELGRGKHPASVKSTVSRVYAVLHWLVEQGQVPRLPARPPLTLPDPLPRHLAPQEVLAIEAVLQQDRAASAAEMGLTRALYYLLCQAGLRISEALDLQVQELDLAARRVRVRDGKGRRDRVVYLSRHAAAGLGVYLQSVPHAAGDLVLSWQGRPLRYEDARARVQALGVAAGVAGVSPHRLRHTYATQLLNNGLSIEALRRLMGHEDLNTTLIYARLADTTLEQQYRAAMDRVTENQVNFV